MCGGGLACNTHQATLRGAQTGDEYCKARYADTGATCADLTISLLDPLSAARSVMCNLPNSTADCLHTIHCCLCHKLNWTLPLDDFVAVESFMQAARAAQCDAAQCQDLIGDDTLDGQRRCGTLFAPPEKHVTIALLSTSW